METTIKTAATVEPISLDELKYHLRIDLDDTDQDDYLNGLIATAREEAEELTWRKFISQTWYAYLDDWPNEDYIVLPFGSLQSVTAIKYTDTDGDQSTWTSSEYIVGTDYLKGRVTLAYGYTWPNTTLYPSNPIQIEFVCGYGDSEASVPAEIKHAIKMLASEMYENRETSLIGMSYQKMDIVNALLSKHSLAEL
jgi:uncharacterized phiE125 gp8 family phage protein